MRHLFNSPYVTGLVLILITMVAGIAVWATRGVNTSNQYRIENKTHYALASRLELITPLPLRACCR